MAILDKIRGAFGEGHQEQHSTTSPGRQTGSAVNTNSTPTSPTSQTSTQASRSTLPSSATSTVSPRSDKTTSAAIPGSNSKTSSAAAPNTSKAMSDGEQLSWETSGGNRNTSSVPDSGSKKMIGTEGAGKPVSANLTPGRNSSGTGTTTGSGAAGNRLDNTSSGNSGRSASGTGAGAGAAGAAGAGAAATNGSNGSGLDTSRTVGSPPRHVTGAAGHPRTGAQATFDPEAKTTTQDHQILAHKTHDNIRHQEEEEVRRVRDIERHQHHVQIHEQPLHHREVRDEIHHQNVVPTTQVTETHSNLPEEHTHFIDQAGRFKDTIVHAPKERSIVDLGEEKREIVHHHVHNAIVPVLEREIVERHRIHTVIPTKHTVHEAPVVHATLTHNPLSLADFQAQGGALNTGLTHHDVAKTLMREGECDRQVTGVGEKMARDLNLKEV